MDYKKHYDLLIARAKDRCLTGYFERHHIVPRCMGGGNEQNNIANLTPEEHYVAHQLLVKIYPDVDSLVYAANKMTVSSKNLKRTNKRYGWLKRKYLKICKKRVGDNNPSYGKSWYHCPVSFKNGKFLEKNVPKGWVKGRCPKIIKKRSCSKCGEEICQREDICRNGGRIKRFIENFGFDVSTIGSKNFYKEYDRIVTTLKKEYEDDLLSVEELKRKYNIQLNETMRCILKSLNIDRRPLSNAVKNYYIKPR